MPEAAETLFSIICVGFVVFVLDSYFDNHDRVHGVHGVVKQFQNYDTASLVNSLPKPLFERDICADITASGNTDYIYAPKFAGKSTISKSIGIESAKKHIPFLYANIASKIEPYEACVSVGKQIGYYDKNTAYHAHDQVRGSRTNDIEKSQPPCYVGMILNAINSAADS